MARVKIGNVRTPVDYLKQFFAPAGFGLGTTIGTISAGGMANFLFSRSSDIALISVRGPLAVSFGSFLVNGYGEGGVERVKVTPLQYSPSIPYGICPKSEQPWGVTIWNNSTNEVYINVLVLFGKMPTFTLNSDGGATPAEYEYENPPMKVGVEYRTTERFKDKPVYRKIVAYNLPASTNADFEVPHGISNFNVLVRQTATIGAGIPLPYTHNENTTWVSEVNNTNIKVSNTGQSWDSSYTWNFYLYYTKTTD